MFLTHFSQVTTLAMVLVCAWALLGGRWPERVTAVAYALNWVGSAIGENRSAAHHAQPILTALDGAFLVVLLLLTVSCRRTWVMWMAACSMLAVLTDVLTALDPDFGPWTFVTAYYVWSLGALLSLGVGMAIEGRRPVTLLIRFG
ncbi:hypothetical protein [Caulobacter sp. S45]|uniref:hypothetical protein n=1 Tax=Caulobacter sp. S45 TaxID=1641861 RepID=UPI0015768E93|nr:hypothetical protein [Caulobacter sp. S45]